MRNRHLLIVLTLLFTFIAGGSLHAQNEPVAERTTGLVRGLSEPHHSKSISEAPPHSIVPHWENGFLVVREEAALENLDPEAHAVTLYDSNGARVRAGRIWFPGAKRVRVRHITVTKEGNIVAVGRAWVSGIREQYFIAKTDLSGNVVDVVWMDPFAAAMACAASDGTVWTFGIEPVKSRLKEDYAMLRQYSFDGGLLREELPRSSFPVGLSPAMWRTPHGSLLHCSEGRVSLYVNRTDEYIEVDGDGTLRRWPVDMSSVGPMKAIGFGLTDSGQAYGSLYEYPRSRKEEERSGFYHLQVDESKGVVRWELIPGTEISLQRGYLVHLYGIDGPSLVVRVPTESNRFVAWVKPIFE